MALAPGTRLGPYEIVGLLGAGGMGEVYRAQDLRLKRSAAIKILPPHLASDPERLARFEREAQVVASLNHSNVAGIYGLEEADGVRALALELVEGSTLEQRLDAGPLVVDETLRIARQICLALAAAHDQGIVHRDLKPANIKIRRDGVVKVLDFGLAKLTSTPDATAATRATGATQAGEILGTPAYMSPEQARGQPVDRRSDMWAFGCVLFEMLSGRSAFTGDSVTDILSAIVSRDPDWSLLPVATPASVQRLLRRCLQKDVARRARDAADAILDLDNLEATPLRAPEVGARPPSSRPVRVWLGAALAAATLVGAGVAVDRYLLSKESEAARPVLRFSVPVPAEFSLQNTRLAMSPDGSRVAYVATGPAGNRLYVHTLDGTPPRALLSAATSEPFFSSDGEWIGFFTARDLSRVNIRSGLVEVICERAGQGAGSGAWTPDGGSILFADGSSIYRVTASGGRPERILSASDQTTRLFYPALLPNGSFLFSSRAVGKPAEIVAYNASSGQQSVIGPGEDASFSASGHLVFAKSGAMFVAPFDADRLALSGSVVPLISEVAQTTNGGAMFGQSQASSAAYITTLPGAARRLVWVDRRGTITPVPAPPKSYQQPRLSRDGTRITVEVLDVPHSIWVYEIAGGRLRRLTEDAEGHNPIWSPDGERVAYQATRAAGEGNNIFARRADGSGQEERLTSGANQQVPETWSESPIGPVIAWNEPDQTTGRDVWEKRLSGDGRPQQLVASRFAESMAQFSPDGRWLAYVSNSSGRNEVFVRPFPDDVAPLQVTSDGGTQPLWSRDGRELFYRSGAALMAVDVATGPTFSTGAPKPLLKTAFFTRDGALDYDVSPDGQRFLMVEPIRAASVELHFVVGWFDELRRLTR